MCVRVCGCLIRAVWYAAGGGCGRVQRGVALCHQVSPADAEGQDYNQRGGGVRRDDGRRMKFKVQAVGAADVMV